MKKQILSMVAVSMLASSMFAASESKGFFDYSVNVGYTTSELTYAPSGSSSKEDGFEIGASASHDCVKIPGVSFVGALNVAVVENSKRYMIDALAKYEVVPNVKIGAGVDYTIVNPDNAAASNWKGFAGVVTAEYEFYKNVGVYAKYLNGTIESQGFELDREDMTAGLTYKF